MLFGTIMFGKATAKDNDLLNFFNPTGDGSQHSPCQVKPAKLFGSLGLIFPQIPRRGDTSGSQLDEFVTNRTK